MRKKWCAAFFVVILLPLCSESLREQNKTYFDSIQWEGLNDLAIPSIPEPYTIEGSRPLPYADTIDDGDILPSLPQLGILDYQNIPEDLLTFCDTITAAIVAKSVDSAFFSTEKAFWPHLGRFMIDHFPDFSYAFYGRPSFKQDGTATVLLRLTVVKSVVVRVSDGNQGTALQQDAVILQDTAAHQDTAARNEDKEPVSLFADNIENAEQGEATMTAKETIAELAENIADAPHFFSDDEQPLFIMMEFGTLKEDNVWKISYLDFKGAEYADSALTD